MKIEKAEKENYCTSNICKNQHWSKGASVVKKNMSINYDYCLLDWTDLLHDSSNLDVFFSLFSQTGQTKWDFKSAWVVIATSLKSWRRSRFPFSWICWWELPNGHPLDELTTRSRDHWCWTWRIPPLGPAPGRGHLDKAMGQNITNQAMAIWISAASDTTKNRLQ